MKKNIHPEYTTDTKVKCVCGNKFVTGSTKKELKLEICSKCHSFYTGKQNLVDSAQRVAKFQKKLDAQKETARLRKGKKAKRIAQKQKRDEREEKKEKAVVKKKK